MVLFAYSFVILIHFMFVDIVWSNNKMCDTSGASESNQKLVSANMITVGKNVWDCREFDACADQLGFEAILLLHQRLDDDANGNIDISESDDFLRGELKYDNGFERQKGFHRSDKHITADELWFTWKSSEVHNWTIEETVQWLISNVELPQYAKNFEEKRIDGTALPRMAVNTMHFLSSLGIKDPIHKQKISLKAMDVVLFGPSKNHNYLKDIIVTLSLIAAVSGVYFGYTINKKSQVHMKKTMKDMESLQHSEEALTSLQRELDQAKIEQEIVATEKKDLERRLQDEITTIKHQDSTGSTDDQSKIQRLEEQLKAALDSLNTAERALHEKSWIPSPALQHWLQLTYELELQHYNLKKAAAERQLAGAKEGCEKLRKKRSSFLGTFRVAHGSSIDDVDNRILQAKAALSEVTIDLQERLHRWKQIEILCGFSVVHNPGLNTLEVILGTTILPSKLSFNRMVRTNSEGTLDEEESLVSFPAGISAIQHLVQNSATLLFPLPSSHMGHYYSQTIENLTISSQASTPSNENPMPVSSSFNAVTGNSQQPDGSLANIPYVCSSRPNMPIGQIAASSDLKSCSSSSAILQRADAVCYDQTECFASDTMDSGEFSGGEHSRPVFTLGDSREPLVRSPISGVKQKTHHLFMKSNKMSETASSISETCSESLESFNGNETSLEGKFVSSKLMSSTCIRSEENHSSFERREVKRKFLPLVSPKSKTS